MPSAFHTAAPLGALGDVDLVQRMAMRVGDAPAELFRRHGSAMFALAYGISRDRGLAEDATQEAKMQAWRDAERYDPARGSVAGWLLVITRGRTLDRLRSRQLRESHIRSGFEVDSVTAVQHSVDVVLERHDRLRSVDAVLDVLPGADRRAIELAYHEGLTHTEIADRLDLPLGTAKTQLRRAIQTLRTALDDRPRQPFQWRIPAAAAARLTGTSILVVDDEPDTVKLTMLVLKRAGASVFTASSAAEALDRLETVWPDVALLDLEMPDVDGYALRSLLHGLCERDGRLLPTVAFTAFCSEPDQLRTRTAGFNLHLAKPIRPALLVASVAQLLGARGRS